MNEVKETGPQGRPPDVLCGGIVTHSRQDVGWARALFNVPNSPAQSATQGGELPTALLVAGLLELGVGVLISLTLLLCLVELATRIFS